MSDKANKEKPRAEAIAALFGSSSFRDEFGGGRSTVMPKEAIVRALGLTQAKCGVVPVWCMETFYASTLTHEQGMARAYAAWHETTHGKDATQHDVAVRRFASALAIRSLAGQRYSTTMLAEYAFLLCCRRERLQAQMATAEAWLSGQLSDGLDEFKRAFWEKEVA